MHHFCQDQCIALQCFILRHLYYLLVLQIYRSIYSECILSCRSVRILFLYTTNPYLFLLYKVHCVLRCLCTQECCLCLFFHARSSATSKRKKDLAGLITSSWRLHAESETAARGPEPAGRISSPHPGGHTNQIRLRLELITWACTLPQQVIRQASMANSSPLLHSPAST